METVITPRLKLVPFKLEMIQAAIKGDDEFSKALGVNIPLNYFGEDINTVQLLPELVKILHQYPLQKEWGWGHLVIHQNDNTLIGHITVKIIPDETGSPTDSIEFGYVIIPSYRQQGYCTEASKAMINWLFSQTNIQTITAGCHPNNIASKRILEKIGMQQIDARENVLVWKMVRLKN